MDASTPTIANILGVIAAPLNGSVWFKLDQVAEAQEIDPRFLPLFVDDLDQADVLRLSGEVFVSERAVKLLGWLGRSAASRIVRNIASDEADMRRPTARR